jgi:hypothetical protein
MRKYFLREKNKDGEGFVSTYPADPTEARTTKLMDLTQTTKQRR